MSLFPDELQEFLKAVAGETRQRILFLFVDGQERNVGKVAQELEIGQSTASEQLALLKRTGLLIVRREGNEVFYFPNRRKIISLLQTLQDIISKCCPS